MNRIYRTIFSRTLGVWVVVSEQAKACGKRGTVSLASALVLAPVTALGASLPTNGQVVSGQGSIASNGKDMTINQGSNKLAIDWNSFDIGAGNSVTFAQPSTKAVALNRVTGGDASAILGNLNANGQVFLVNPNGILFGKSASVNVGGLVASTLDLPVAQFNKGNYQFKGNGTPGAVVNQGKLTAADGGAVALLGGSVSNQGVIVANQGTVALAAGNAMTLDFAGDGLLNVQVDEGVANALAENQQLIRAKGGQVILTAKASDALLQTVVNNTGVIEAQTLGSKAGKIVLLGGDEGGTVQVAGTLDASAPAGGNGGFVETSGAHVQVASTAKVTTKSSTGKTGNWVVDPTNFNINAGSASQSDSGMGADTLSANLENNNVTLATVSSGSEAGDINVNAAVGWKANTQLTLNAHGNINVNAAITATGDSAGLALNHGDSASTGTAASGTGYNIKAPVTLSGKNASLSVNGQAYTLIHSMAELDAIDSTGLSGHYALAQDLNASGITYRRELVGTNGARFTGTFSGLGHTISNLTINGSNFAGLFGFIGTGSVIRDVGLVGGSVTGSYGVGALAAYNVGGSISNSYSTVNVAGGSRVGGLVGSNDAAGSSITNSYSTGNVTGADSVGGVAGFNAGTVTNAYALGKVNGTASVGGLVGFNTGTVNSAYATGAVTGTDATTNGGLIGLNNGTVNNAYWDAGSTGQALAAGSGTGALNATDVSSGRYNAGSYGNLGTWTAVANNNPFGNTVYVAKDSSGNATWIMIQGQSRPFLAAEYSTTVVNAHQLQLMAYNLSGNYALGSNIDASMTAGSNLSDMWGSTGFSPVGSSNYGFSGYGFNGTFDGANHTIYGLTIAAQTSGGSGSGLFGYVNNGASIGNVQLSNANVSGGAYAGGLVGFNQGSIYNAIVSGTITGQSYTGGVTGVNFGSITNAYTDTLIAGSYYGGGISGYNAGTISYTYALGTLTSQTGGNAGIVGVNNGNVLSSFYATTDASGNAINAGLNATGSGGNTTEASGKTRAELSDLSTFTAAGWNIDSAAGTGSTWRIYDGYSTPLLRSFLTAITLSPSLSNAGKTYDGTVATGLVSSYTSDIALNSDLLKGAFTYTTTGKDAGTYSTADNTLLIGGGLYSTQNGYDIAIEASSSLTIAQKVLTAQIIADSKTYDGTTAANVHGSVSGVVAGEDVALATNGSFADKNAGSGKLVNVSGAISGNDVANYVLSSNTTAWANIGQATVLGLITASSKIYDASTAAATEARLNGVLGSDVVNVSSSGTFSDKNAGTGKLVNVAGTLSGADAGNYLLVSNHTTTANVAQKALTGTIVADGKTYDGTTDATVHGSLDGLVSGDSVALDTAGSFADKNAGNGKLVNVTGAISGTDAANYLLSSNTTTTANVAQKALTGAIVADGKTYDGTTSAAVQGSLDGVVSGDRVTLATSGSFADKNAGNGKLVNVTGAISGTDAANYLLSSNSTTTANIGQKALTGAITAGGKTYDGNTSASTQGSLDGLISGDSVALATSGSFADKSAGNGKLVNVTGAISGADAANYLLSSNSTTTANIAQKALTGAIVADGKTYDGTTSATTQGTLDGVVAGDSVSLATSGSFADKNAGTGKLVNVTGAISGTDAGNYLLSSNATTTASIAQKALTGAITANGKTYDATTAAATQGSLDGVVSGDAVALATAGSFADKNAGTGKLVNVAGTISGADAGNYVLSSNAITTANIAQKALTGTITASGKTYDSTTAATTQASLDGVISGDSVALATAGSFADKNAGNGKLVNVTGTISGTDAGNYLLSSNATTTANIAQKALTGAITANGKTYDGTTAATTQASLDGVVSGDNVTLATTGSFADKNAGNGKLVNVTGTISGTDAGNYLLSSNATTIANIAQKALTGTITASGKTYDATTAAATQGSLDGVVSGDAVTLATAGSFADKNAGNGKLVNVTGTINGTDAGNYALSSNATTTANIAQKALTGAITASGKTYDATTTATTQGSLDGVISGDAVALATAGSFADKNAGNGKLVNVTGTISGTDAGNYLLSSNATTTANIAQKALNGAITASGKTYDATTAAATQGSLHGVVSGDTVTLATAGSFADKNAGNGKLVNVTGTISGTDAANYLLSTNATTNATIDQAALTISAADAAKAFGELAALDRYSTAGLLAGDSVSTVAITSPGAGAEAAAGNYIIQASNATGEGLNNYAIRYLDGQLAVAAGPSTTPTTPTDPTPPNPPVTPVPPVTPTTPDRTAGIPYEAIRASNQGFAEQAPARPETKPMQEAPLPVSSFNTSSVLAAVPGLEVINNGIRLPEGM
jgi:filamentous hemagglutinin family protein